MNFYRSQSNDEPQIVYGKPVRNSILCESVPSCLQRDTTRRSNRSGAFRSSILVSTCIASIAETTLQTFPVFVLRASRCNFKA